MPSTSAAVSVGEMAAGKSEKPGRSTHEQGTQGEEGRAEATARVSTLQYGTSTAASGCQKIGTYVCATSVHSRMNNQYGDTAMSGLLTFDGGLPDQAMELLVEVLTDPWELCLDAPQEHYGIPGTATSTAVPPAGRSTTQIRTARIRPMKPFRVNGLRRIKSDGNPAEYFPPLLRRARTDPGGQF